MSVVTMSSEGIRVDIQALRAVAVGAVVMCHMNPEWLPGGYLGVDIFFVISGFVITQLLWKQSGPIRFGQFWLQRLLRIFPAYAVMLTLVSLCAAVLFLPENFVQFGQSWRKSLVFFSNQYFASYGDYFSATLAEQPLLHSWSLSIEMQFYLIYPFFFLIASQTRRPSLLLFATVMGFALAQLYWTLSSDVTALYYSLHIRSSEFLLGCTLAAYAKYLIFQQDRQWKLAAAGFLVILFSLLFINEKRFQPITAAIACFGTGLVIAADVQKGQLARVYSIKSVLMIGALSYSIYLWHWPILAFMRYSYGAIDWSFLHIVIYLSSVFLISWLSWFFIERSFKIKSPSDRPFQIKKLLLVVVMALSPALFAKQVNDAIPDLPVNFRRYVDPATICHGKILQNCSRGLGKKQYLVIGDSHAAMLNIAMEVAAVRLNANFEVITASNCIPIAGFNIQKLPSWAQKECQKQIDSIAEKIINSKSIILAGMWSYHFQDQQFENSIRNFFDRFNNQNHQIYVLGQIPKMNLNPRRADRLPFDDEEGKYKQASDSNFGNSKMKDIVAEYSFIQFFLPSKDKMFDAAPYYDGVLIYSDDHHLNEIGSRYYSILLEKWLVQ